MSIDFGWSYKSKQENRLHIVQFKTHGAKIKRSRYFKNKLRHKCGARMKNSSDRQMTSMENRNNQVITINQQHKILLNYLRNHVSIRKSKDHTMRHLSRYNVNTNWTMGYNISHSANRHLINERTNISSTKLRAWSATPTRRSNKKGYTATLEAKLSAKSCNINPFRFIFYGFLRSRDCKPFLALIPQHGCV